MKRGKYPDTHRYMFEMLVDIDRAVIFSAGELAALIVDGLFALDQQAALFPGITSPENRLATVSLGAIGHRRRARAAPVDQAYSRLMTSNWRPGREDRSLKDDLEKAGEQMIGIILRQRMLMALIQGLVNRCRHPTALTDADRLQGESLIAATDAITAAVNGATKLVL